MTAYFVSIMVIGILLIMVSLISIAIEKSKQHDYRLDLNERKYELVDTIEDAEQLIDELNKFSDYSMQKIEQVNNKLEKTIGVAVEKMDLLNNISIEKAEVKEDIVDNIEISNSGVNEKINKKKRYSQKIIPIDKKRRDIYALAQSGLNSTEIAKQLNIGKGEIQLILGLNKVEGL